MRLSIQRVGFGVVVTVMALAATETAEADGTWRGLTVAPEHRCAPYDRDDYPYSQSVETRIIASMGGRVYGPYTGRYFASRRETDIDTWWRHRRRMTAGCAPRTPGRSAGSRVTC